MATHEELFNDIAANVCNKMGGLTAEDCFLKTTNSLCRNHDRCRLYEKTLTQLEYVKQPITENTFLRACPGSGKTEVVGLKAAHEIKSWDHVGKGVAVLTFTNNAANEIAERITQFAGSSGTAYPHFVGTIDSWIHGYIANPFAHLWTDYPGINGDRSLRVIETGYQADWLKAFAALTKYSSGQGRFTPIYANNYYIDTETGLIHILPLGGSKWITHTDLFNSPQFRKFRSDKPWLTAKRFFYGFWETKIRFWKVGFCTYQDIEFLAHGILDDDQNDVGAVLSKRFPLIIIDECQDLSWVQLNVLGKLRELGSTLHFVGDLNQGIYSFKKVFPKKVKEFADSEGFKEMSLDENFRSVQPIVDLCGGLCDQGSIAGRSVNGDSQPNCVLFTYPVDQIHEIPKQFSDYIKGIGLDVYNSAILARGKTLIGKLRAGGIESSIGKSELPNLAILLWNTCDWERQKIALQYLGKYMAMMCFPEDRTDSRNQYCPESLMSKIQWRIYLAAILKECCLCPELVNLDQKWSAWSKSFKSLFPGITSEFAEKNEISLPDVKFNYIAPRGKASTQIANCMTGVQAVESTDIRITTIHQVKGETHDATLLVSSPDKRGGKGSHWSEWLDDSVDDGEHSRFAYVASSRPKYLLAWAIPESNDEEIATIQKLGFKLINIENP